ncbi:hatching enzyme-like [Mytilus californianus]|uniref:hatching enzyme-like n=1 Tax=Mytilus californianus TaxID=6549 RepID=UPI00224643BF|nr:hatching enzyme-like [Mytilus californianus]
MKSSLTVFLIFLVSVWRKKKLKWRITEFTSQLSDSVVRSELARALKAWSDVSALSFTEVTSGEDIHIKFVKGDHGDGFPFDGPGGVIVHAFYPEDGRTHFDDEDIWVVNTTGTDLFTNAAHEFGHALGLGHTNVEGAVMTPVDTGYVPNYKLHPADIAGIRALYDNRPKICRNGYEATIRAGIVIIPY